MDLSRLTPGLEAEMLRRVTRGRTVSPGRAGTAVLSTAPMIRLMEDAGHRAVRTRLPGGHTTVGFHVDVKHVAPTAIGEFVRIKAKLLQVDGNKLTFEVVAYHGEQKVGMGLHRRAVVPIPPRT